MMKDGLLAEYDHEIATTRKLLERLPDDKLAWKPHVKSMSLGGLGTHLANLPLWAGAILNDTCFDLASLPPNLAEKTSHADILAAFDENTKRARGWMDKTDAESSPAGRSIAAARKFLDAPHRRVPQLRAEPSDSPSRAVERLPAPERHPGAADLRTVGGRGVNRGQLGRYRPLTYVTMTASTSTSGAGCPSRIAGRARDRARRPTSRSPSSPRRCRSGS